MQTGEHSVREISDTSCVFAANRKRVSYHVGPVDNCSAVPPAAQDFSLEHLGVVTEMKVHTPT